MDTYTSVIVLIKKIGYEISPLFLLLTFIVYTILPELRNTYGRILRGYFGCEVLAHVFRKVDLATRPNKMNPQCISMGFATYFFDTAAILWLNMCCFDLRLSLGSSYPVNGNNDQRERKKFIVYSIFAWGCAILLTVILAITIFAEEIPNPRENEVRYSIFCFFTQEAGVGVYLFILLSIVIPMSCNVILFILTVVKIIRLKMETARHLRGTDSRRHDNSANSVFLYVKLFVVMGMDSCLIPIAIILGAPKEIMGILIIINYYQGTIIFIIFVCKKRILRLLIERFRCRKLNCFMRNSTSDAFQSSTAPTAMTCVSPHEKTSSSSERF